MMRAATTLPATGSPNPWTVELNSLSPSAYLERIRLMAYYYWAAAGRGYGHALDFWLQAERDMLSTIAAEAERNARSERGDETVSTPEAGTRSKKTPAESASASRPGSMRPTKEPRPT
jgi:hypothetical protein